MSIGGFLWQLRATPPEDPAAQAPDRGLDPPLPTARNRPSTAALRSPKTTLPTRQAGLSIDATVVFDHFAQAQAALGVGQPGFAALVRLLTAGRAYVKLSAAYRISTLGPDYADVKPLAKALIAANPQRILWGSDWPHPDAESRPGRRSTDLRPPLPVDDGRVLNQLAAWAPDAALRHAILVENPAQLYGFEPSRS
jgi:predicted TIM-barrel fold metal-dependent hydrolase